MALPDGTRTYIAVAWTDLGGDDNCAAPPANHARIGRLADLVHLRLVADALLERRGESPPDTEEKRPWSLAVYAWSGRLPFRTQDSLRSARLGLTPTELSSARHH